ncbi:MAG: hypothetical protein IJ275_00445 [Ruminococcus sp.]|nr:hypothetical protein [Ruminococcus sp.]
MKRIVSVIIMLSIIFSLCAISATALEVDTLTEPSDIEVQVMAEVEKAFDKLTLEYQQEHNLVFDEIYYIDIWDYYCHFADKNTIDYVYVNWSFSVGSDAIIGERYLDYCIRSPQIYSPTIGLYIYDVENKEIYTFEEAEIYAKNYLKDFLDNHREKIAPYYKIFVCGDVDFDGELSILDATKIQLVLAGLDTFSYYESFSGYGPKRIYVSDVDGDGSRSVMDATAIQLKLAGLE